MAIKSNRAVFLDLNGTLVLPLKPASLSEIKIIPGADIAVARLVKENFICPVITIQSGIAKKRFTEQEFRDWFSAFFTNLELDIKGPYICPHRFSEDCICKKPNSFLYAQAAKDYSIELSGSYIIGDTTWDMIAGKNIGAHSCLVRTGWAMSNPGYRNAMMHASFTGKTLTEVVNWILKNEINIS